MIHLNKSGIYTLLFGAMLSTAAYSQTKKSANMTQVQDAALFPKGDKLPDSYFTGGAFLTPLIAKDKNNDFMMGSVTFEPGARTHWHTHPRGQVLIVTEGDGFYQEKGKPAQPIKKGDVVNIPENTAHWHGAAEKTKMVHIAITNYEGEANVVWLKPVSDEEYAAVNKQ
ncbi:cupin domain-containing protein [Dyadobacter sp. CY326]|uniref:(R)-mandelonitrile lyase n=1 Tax=Dyadobacter sp. CY326 TaxID=2907300 RepID=UPI001F1DC52B|nr:cupin domain-containing protein [Dyadobacter sp. CY326]MCE7067379.1 cupin domain-containing protein [Dyadobacter sp. CY326]